MKRFSIRVIERTILALYRLRKRLVSGARTRNAIQSAGSARSTDEAFECAVVEGASISSIDASSITVGTIIVRQFSA